jgi:predicted ATP-dependent endonuclease of OLD family
MKETLIVKNLGPLKDLELDLKPTMVFIGPQASGKSTLAKLIAIVRDDGFLASIDENLSSYMAQGGMAFFQDYNIQNFFSEETYFSYSSARYSIVYDKGHFKSSSVSALEATKIDKILNSFGGEKPDLQFVKFLSFFSNPHNKSSIYIPAERSFIPLVSGAFFNLANNNVPIPKNILTFGAAFERARSELPELEIDFLGIVYKYENNQDRIYLKPGQSLKLTESSSGLQAVIPLVVTIEANYRTQQGSHPGILFVIEEPELNLYPITQKELVNYLIAKCTSRSTPEGTNELVITTHSPYILSAFSNCLFAYSVAQKRPDKKEAINAIVPQASWLNPDQFNAYYVANSQVENIFNPDTGVIRESMLDEASEMIGGEFYDLMDIYKEKV